MIELGLFCIGFIVEVCRLLIDLNEKETQPKLRFWIASGILSGLTTVSICLIIPFFFALEKDQTALGSIKFSVAVLVGTIGWLKIQKIFITPLLSKLEKKIEDKIAK